MHDQESSQEEAVEVTVEGRSPPNGMTVSTFATWLLEGGADIRWVQRQLGHASIGQTADTYGHVQPERHEAAVEGLDRYMG